MGNHHLTDRIINFRLAPEGWNVVFAHHMKREYSRGFYRTPLAGWALVDRLDEDTNERQMCLLALVCLGDGLTIADHCRSYLGVESPDEAGVDWSVAADDMREDWAQEKAEREAKKASALAAPRRDQ